MPNVPLSALLAPAVQTARRSILASRRVHSLAASSTAHQQHAQQRNHGPAMHKFMSTAASTTSSEPSPAGIHSTVTIADAAAAVASTTVTSSNKPGSVSGPSLTELPSSSTDLMARIFAFSVRTGISFDSEDSSDILLDALTHKSFKYHRNENSKGRYFYLGGQVLQMYASEYVLCKYPEMPLEAVQSIVRAYTSPRVLSQVGMNFGVQLLMRWKGTKTDGSTNSGSETGDLTAALKKPSEDNENMGEAAVRSWVTQALIGAIYQHKGPAAARRFVHTYFLSRVVDVDAHLDVYVKMNTPRLLLVQLCKRFNRPTPVARLIKETGRLSNNAVFIVGMYSGIDKIGEGYGSSLRMAETRAVKDALFKQYSQEIQNVKLPSDEYDNLDREEDALSFFERQENEIVSQETQN